MRASCRPVAFAVILAASASVPTITRALDDPWPMFRHDLRHTGQTPYTGPAEPAVHWTFTANDGIASSPAIAADGTVYIGTGWFYPGSTDPALYAINADGSLKWRYETNEGVFASPTIGPDGTIYFTSLDGGVYALEDAITHGNLLWRTQISFLIHSSPAVAPDGTIYVGDLTFNLNAIDSNGAVKWAYWTNWCIISSAAIGPEGEIYVGSKDHHLYAFEDSLTYGKVRWQAPTGVFFDGHLVDSSPAIGPDGTLYVGTDPYGAAGQTPVPVDTAFFAFAPDGSLKWTFEMQDGAESSPAIGPDGTIYIGSYDHNLYAIRDAGNEGVLEWQFTTRGAIDSSPAVDGCGTVYVTSRDSTVYAINPDGSLRWSFRADDAIESSPAIDAGGILYVGTFGGTVYALGNVGSDAGVQSVYLPEEVRVGSTYDPVGTVRNYRAGAQSFAVSCTIDSAGVSVYGDTLGVTDLPGAASTALAFAPWTVGPDTGVVYTVTVTTLLDGDNNAYNDALGVATRSTADAVAAPDAALDQPRSRLVLNQSFPNPFNPATTIRFELSTAMRVSLRVFDTTGRLVRVLVDDALQTAGRHELTWDGRDDHRQELPSGIYFCRLEAEGVRETQRMVLVR